MRLLLQPAVASLIALRDGWRDAKSGRPVWFWSLLTDRARRRERLREGWKAVGKIFLIALALDTVYQLLVFRWLYPGEALLVATLLAFMPYLLLRGTVNRLARPFVNRRSRP